MAESVHVCDMFGLSWTLFLLQLTSALGHSVLAYPLFRVGSWTCADRGSVALLLWKLPLASDDGLAEARNTLQELTAKLRVWLREHNQAWSSNGRCLESCTAACGGAPAVRMGTRVNPVSSRRMSSWL